MIAGFDRIREIMDLVMVFVDCTAKSVLDLGRSNKLVGLVGSVCLISEAVSWLSWLKRLILSEAFLGYSMPWTLSILDLIKLLPGSPVNLAATFKGNACLTYLNPSVHTGLCCTAEYSCYTVLPRSGLASILWFMVRSAEVLINLLNSSGLDFFSNESLYFSSIIRECSLSNTRLPSLPLILFSAKILWFWLL